VVTCSVETHILWPPDNSLVTVGLETHATDDCGLNFPFPFVDVYSDEPDLTTLDLLALDGHSPDAQRTGQTLRLRAEREGSDGRIYLIVATAFDRAGNLGIACCTVIVPGNLSNRDFTSVRQRAEAAAAHVLANDGAPPSGFGLVGDGPTTGRR
jgi:hypothetical protein